MRHVLDLESVGMVATDASAANQGAVDCSPIWNKFVPSTREYEILLPQGYCAFKSPIAPLPSSTRSFSARVIAT